MQRAAHGQSAGIPLYTYEFDDQTAPFHFPKMPGFPLAGLPPTSTAALWRSWRGAASQDSWFGWNPEPPVAQSRRFFGEARMGPGGNAPKVAALASSIQAGAWSPAFSQPRTARSTPAAISRSAIAGESRK